jgi:hypothetical protein
VKEDLMSINIQDSDAFDRISQIEGVSWALVQADSPPCDNNWKGVRKQWRQEVAEEKAFGEEAAFARFEGKPCTSSLYGAGGFHRYFILGSGEIVFSRYHAGEKATKKAEAVGFRIW